MSSSKSEESDELDPKLSSEIELSCILSDWLSIELFDWFLESSKVKLQLYPCRITSVVYLSFPS